MESSSEVGDPSQLRELVGEGKIQYHFDNLGGGVMSASVQNVYAYEMFMWK